MADKFAYDGNYAGTWPLRERKSFRQDNWINKD